MSATLDDHILRLAPFDRINNFAKVDMGLAADVGTLQRLPKVGKVKRNNYEESNLLTRYKVLSKNS